MVTAECEAVAEQQPFTYDTLDEPDVRWLRGAATELRFKLRRTVAEVVASGKLLAAARKRLGRARWKPWLAREAQIPLRSAGRLVNVGTAFGGLSDSAILNFTPTALYTLAEPGVPQSIREFAVSQARDGEEVTATRVEEWLTAFREQLPDITSRRELKALAPKDEQPKPNPIDPADVFAKENWLSLCALVGEESTVHLSGCKDTENDTVSYAGVRIDGAGKVKRATAGTVEAVVLELAGGVRTKVCARCGEDKPLDAYCRRGDLPDGREYRCKKCEAERVKTHVAKKGAAVAGEVREVDVVRTRADRSDSRSVSIYRPLAVSGDVARSGAAFCLASSVKGFLLPHYTV